MTRHIFSFFLFASLILLVSPLLPAAGAGDALQAGLQEAGPAPIVADKASNAPPEAEGDAFLEKTHSTPRVSPLDFLRGKNPNLKKLLLSGVGLMLVVVTSMMFDSFYLLKKVEAMQEKVPNLSDVEAYRRVLSTDLRATVLGSIIALLAVGFGFSVGAHLVKGFRGMKAAKDQEEFEKNLKDPM